jgi:hypothetical protein
MCGAQIPVGTAKSHHPQIGHRLHAQVTLESRLQRAHADVALRRQRRGGQRQVRSGLMMSHRVSQRCRSTRLST